MKIATILSSLLAGGLLLGSAYSVADRGGPPGPPAPPPLPPGAPGGHSGARPPAPPRPPKAPKVQVQIDGLDDMIEDHLQVALDSINGNPQIPADVRAKLTRRLESVRKKLQARVGSGKALDPQTLGDIGEEIGEEMEAFGEEMEKWGEQYGKDMEKWGEQYGKDMEKWGEQFGKDMEKWGEQLGKDMAKKFGGIDIDIDDDDDDIGLDLDDDDDVDDALRDLGDLKLAPAQREQIRKLRADSDAKVAAARRDLDRASDRLQEQLDTPGTSDAEIARSIDTVAQHEAAIRKARILAWHNARRILDDAQRKQVEGAARGKRK